MERRFRNDTALQEAYSRFMGEYESLQHMSLASPLGKGEIRACYLPHHGVFKTGEPTKIRVVFNGSARLASGNSLNDMLTTGPNLLPNLADVLSRWRRHQYAMASDIEKMYRQIMVHPEDRDLQRILWRSSPDHSIQEYRLNAVTYGLTCAPYLAIRTLRQLANDEQERYPLGAAALRSDVYVDDVLIGADSLEEASRLQEQLTQLCLAGGFPLKKWAANAEKLLHDIPMTNRQPSFREWEPEMSHATLGLRWHPKTDDFAFRVIKIENEKVTKRRVLSESARLFDPLGWLAPTVVVAKMLIQTLWQQRIEWDQPVSPGDERTWLRFRSELPALEAVRVPRWLHTAASASRMELHGFADASERAIAAVVYLVSRSGTRDCHVTLLQAKTRVTPLRQVSIPRLELNAAALLVRVVEHAKVNLEIPVAEVHLWSDSMVALGWIRGHPSRWKTYVANRVADIQRALPEAVWHHVPGEENPADCASRGLLPGELVQHSLWWRGPSWLKSGEDYPQDHALESGREGRLPEQRAGIHVAAIIKEDNQVLLQFSTLHRLLRVTAWCRRWLRVRSTARQSSVSGPLTFQDLEEAERQWTLGVQTRWFAEERTAVARGGPVQGRSSLRKLNPFLDDRGLLRVGGRLKHAILSHDERHPIILPARSHYTALVVDAVHRRTLHGGVQLTLGTLRQRQWIPGGRRLVRSRIHRCLPCTRWRAASPSPLMGDLPPPRVNISRAFTHTGIDYAGPVLLRAAKGRGRRVLKGFLAIFVCLCTRAVHIEVASDYTTEAFLAAFRRFVSRRGLCAAVYSDRGTNFVGADAQLRRFLQDVARERHVATVLANDGIEWKFNPPAAPHFGGIWEAAVKSSKHHLRRVLGETVLTFEELTTLLAQVEACLNSRPLLALSDDPEDLAALTPGHFLVGTALNAVPEPSLEEVVHNRLTRWQLVQKMRDHFWARWSKEYLHSLTQRPKWWKKDVNLCPGDLCLVRSTTTPPTKWPLARIVAVHPGKDGQVRVVTIRTATSTLQRPTTKLVPLADTKSEEGEENNKDTGKVCQ